MSKPRVTLVDETKKETYLDVMASALSTAMLFIGQSLFGSCNQSHEDPKDWKLENGAGHVPWKSESQGMYAKFGLRLGLLYVPQGIGYAMLRSHIIGSLDGAYEGLVLLEDDTELLRKFAKVTTSVGRNRSALKDYAFYMRFVRDRILGLINAYFGSEGNLSSVGKTKEYLDNILTEYINIFTIPNKMVCSFPDSIVVKFCQEDYQWKTILDNLKKAKEAIQQEFKDVRQEDFEKLEYSHLRYNGTNVPSKAPSEVPSKKPPH